MVVIWRRDLREAQQIPAEDFGSPDWLGSRAERRALSSGTGSAMNANLLRRWVVEAERATKLPQGSPQRKAPPPPSIEASPFIPVAIEKPAHASAAEL